MSTGTLEEKGRGMEAAPQRGLAAWLIDGWLGLMERGQKRKVQRHLRVLETLAIGGKKTLLLVSCGGERFLVGTGPENVQTIVRVRSEAARGELTLTGSGEEH